MWPQKDVKRASVIIIRIVLDLRGVIVDWKRLFSLNMNSLFYLTDVRSEILQSLDFF